MRSLAPAIPTLAPRVGYQPGDAAARDRYRTDTQPWRAWYVSKRWRKLRWQVLTEHLFTCTGCKRVVTPSSQAVVDHKVPHRGDPRLFWDHANLQCLCKPCHDSVKQREEASATARGTGGWVQPANGRGQGNPRCSHGRNFKPDG
jgi:hypothetical protein